ncbi:MAG: ECF transporter S component [Lachnospiraceae bacterium]|nr:ECF transporter S component [Candidatus Colinaster equi]
MTKYRISLPKLIFMALCCDLGIIAKKLIAPAANVVTEFLHIPGGISVSFSLMFILIGAYICNIPFAATLMCVLQCVLALCMGTTGSLGMLAIIGYIVPGIVMDICIFLFSHTRIERTEQIVLVNAIAGVSAAACANMLTFRLISIPLYLYLAVSFTSGILCGILGGILIKRVGHICRFEK